MREKKQNEILVQVKPAAVVINGTKIDLHNNFNFCLLQRKPALT